MAIEASISKFKRTNLKIYAAFCIGAAIFFGYDGYLSKYEWSYRRSFYEKHVKDGQPDDSMKFNRIAPIFLVGGAAVFAAWFWALKDKKLLAKENELIIADKESIRYDRIQKIDKTHFGSDGYFIITYKNTAGNEVDRKISDRKYDNLEPLLDYLVTKIS